eukprot:1468523-Prymnesium_polylepis.1
MQYTEIYNEKIKDLLNPSDAQLDVREVPSKGTYVAGATEKQASARRPVRRAAPSLSTRRTALLSRFGLSLIHISEPTRRS